MKNGDIIKSKNKRNGQIQCYPFEIYKDEEFIRKAIRIHQLQTSSQWIQKGEHLFSPWRGSGGISLLEYYLLIQPRFRLFQYQFFRHKIYIPFMWARCFLLRYPLTRLHKWRYNRAIKFIHKNYDRNYASCHEWKLDLKNLKADVWDGKLDALADLIYELYWDGTISKIVELQKMFALSKEMETTGG